MDNTEADHDRLVRLEQRLDGLEARSGQMLSLIAAGTGIFLALLALLAAIIN